MNDDGADIDLSRLPYGTIENTGKQWQVNGKCYKCGGTAQPMRTLNLGRHHDMRLCNKCWLAPFQDSATLSKCTDDMVK